MAIDVSKINEYVDENRLPLIRKAVTGAPTLNYIEKMYGVKGPTKLNLLDTEVTFADGSACGFEDSGNSELSQREINPAIIKVDKSFCDRVLAKYFLNSEVRLAAGQAKLPAEGQFVESIVDGVKEQVEQFVWNGAKIGATTYNGFLDFGQYMTQATKGDTIYASVKNVYKAIPAKSLKDSVIFMGQGDFRDLVMELTEKNLYHDNPVVNDSWEIVLPGTVTKVVGVPGLDGKNAIVALNTKHAFYGTDMAGDDENIDVWYSKDEREFRSEILFSAGQNVAFPDENVYCDITPTVEP